MFFRQFIKLLVLSTIFSTSTFANTLNGNEKAQDIEDFLSGNYKPKKNQSHIDIGFVSADNSFKTDLKGHKTHGLSVSGSIEFYGMRACLKVNFEKGKDIEIDSQEICIEKDLFISEQTYITFMISAVHATIREYWTKNSSTYDLDDNLGGSTGIKFTHRLTERLRISLGYTAQYVYEEGEHLKKKKNQLKHEINSSFEYFITKKLAICNKLSLIENDLRTQICIRYLF